MAWELDCGYAPAYEHEEGHLVTVLDDGTEAGGWWPEIAARIAGWYIGCSCGWRASEFWTRDPADDVGHPPAELDGDAHDALTRTWRAHLDEVCPEIRVAETALLDRAERDRLDDAVRLARTFGASWSTVAAAAGMSRQAAHERWVPTAAPQERSPTVTEHDRITSYDAAANVYAHQHAGWYATQRPLGNAAGPDDAIEEIARMTVLAERLRRERPLLFHRAARSGASITELAAAACVSPSQVCAEWRAWADGQRQLATSTMSPVGGGTAVGLDAAEYAAVEAELGVDGIRRDPELPTDQT